MPISTAAAILGAGALGAGASLFGANKAASAQEKAANQATNVQQQMFNTVQQNLQPYNQAGVSAQNMLNAQLPNLTSPITMDEATLKNTPGYQFTRDQGLEALQNSFAARGLGSSGAALKGAAQYATGLADNTYQQQFQNAVTNQQNAYNRLLGISSLGENAAAGVGNAALQTGSNIGNNLIGAGNAQAGSYIAGANAINGLGQSVPNALLTNQLLNSQNGGSSGLFGGQFAGGASGWTNPDTGITYGQLGA